MPDRGTPNRKANGGDGLERELEKLGANLEYPQTPDLAGAVRRRLDEDDPRAATGRSLPVWAVAAAVIAVFVVVPALAFVSFAPFGGDGISRGGQVAGSGGDAEKAAPERAEGDSMTAESQSPAESEAGAPSTAVGTDADQSSALGEGLGLEDPISLEEAEVRMGSLLLPSGLGRPDETYAVEGPTGNGVAFVYAARGGLPSTGGTAVGLVLTGLPGDVEGAFGTGTATPDGAEGVEVGGSRGIWLPSPESPGAEAFRLTENLRGSVLFFTRDGVALRLESSLPRGEAIRLAESVE